MWFLSQHRDMKSSWCDMENKLSRQSNSQTTANVSHGRALKLWGLGFYLSRFFHAWKQSLHEALQKQDKNYSDVELGLYMTFCSI